MKTPHRDRHLPKPVEAPAADRVVTAQDNRPKIDKLSAEDLIVDHADLSATLRDLTARSGQLPPPPTPETSIESIEANATVIAMFGRDVQKFIADVAARHSTTKQPYREIGDLIDAHFNKGMRDVAKPFQTRAASLGASFVDEKDRRERARLAQIAEENRRREQERLDLAAKAEAQGDHTTAEVLVAQAENSERQADIAASRATSAGTLGGVRTSGGSMSVKKTLGFDFDKAKVDLEALRPFLDMDAIEKAISGFNRANGNGLTDTKELSIKTPITGVTFKVVSAGAFRG